MLANEPCLFGIGFGFRFGFACGFGFGFGFGLGFGFWFGLGLGLGLRYIPLLLHGLLVSCQFLLDIFHGVLPVTFVLGLGSA